mmetsp:Transcript_36669/g.59266  ORF Transcript_36669/g.59266 Transcript_36669/m.59266 type:complete len:147 (+) Transcript_36669:121-561(+)|eukprot:CAMPEP_0184643358 /NCGR_PEP_ID=MMETSP0308-20130426/192_1 /TAXON_ID=38269 /ORGANISM="Gloeochaete witrockiana, Strain SAG 46.84" /LENGTH=146 /DNA_ID=CAMNT_0027071239 /DNA_START=104 /DNA_END=544 /DNA_ORIENTATION=-
MADKADKGDKADKADKVDKSKEDLLDESIFDQLEELQDETQPHFVEEVITLYLETSAEKLAEMQSLLEKKDLDELAKSAHSLKGSSANIGAVKVVKICADLKGLCENRDYQGVKKALADAHEQFDLVKEVLEKRKNKSASKEETKS